MDEKLMTLPVIALRGLTVLPEMIQHFDISRDKSISAVEHAMVGEQKVFLVTQRQIEEEDPDASGLFQIGTIARIKQLVKIPGGLVRVMVEGLERAELINLLQDDPYLEAEVAEAPLMEENLSDTVKEAMARIVKEKLEEFGNGNPKTVKDFMGGLMAITDLNELLIQTAGQFPWEYTVKQELLECGYVSHLYDRVVYYLMREIEILKIKRDYQGKVKASIDKNQRDYILREELKVIQEELGEEYTGSDADSFLEQLEKLNADKETKEKIRKEIMRFKAMPGGSQEANVLRTYIETVLELPWKKTSRDNQDIRHAEKILEEDHYGLEKIKERILEYLSVRILSPESKGPILCFVGPPGVGKTSLAQSIARALGRNFARISLGGVHDEAEIRGHRRTYIGAMPGRFIEAMQQAKTINPLLLLDEIDKVGNDFRGDPASALLEALDPEQNKEFHDNYIDIPYDLSKVFFIATANTLSTIPAALLDRMEVISLSGYTEGEKLEIAKKYLVPRQRKQNGLKASQIKFSDTLLRKIIRNYTREAGVRGLERTIGSLCRKVAKKVVMHDESMPELSARTYEKYLGPVKYMPMAEEHPSAVGRVNGLAWTAAGGEVLDTEAVAIPGKGRLTLTGSLGDVMKESATAAYTYVKSRASDLKLKEDFWEKLDLHLHFPEGAVPKDGPSAGVTIATAIASAVTGRKVRSDTAMTGEINLLGEVLPIGGVKEKVLAADQLGIKQVLLPEKNRKDLEEVPDDVKKRVHFVFVKNADDVLKHALM